MEHHIMNLITSTKFYIVKGMILFPFQLSADHKKYCYVTDPSCLWYRWGVRSASWRKKNWSPSGASSPLRCSSIVWNVLFIMVCFCGRIIIFKQTRMNLATTNHLSARCQVLCGYLFFNVSCLPSLLLCLVRWGWEMTYLLRSWQWHY